MTIIDKIRKSVQDVHGEDFAVYYHDEPTLNLIADEMTFPCAFVMLLTNGRAIFEGGQVKEQVGGVVYFVESSEFDFDADENEEIINRCKERCFEWLQALQMDKYITLEAVERTQRAYERFDAILTGFGVALQLKERAGVC